MEDYDAWWRLCGPLHIPTETLFKSFNARLTDSGQIVTEQVIPFSFVRGGWIQDTQMRWIRLMVPSGPEQAVRTAIKPMHIASKDLVIRLAVLAPQARMNMAARKLRLKT